jgi:ribosome-binding protein aMBF1 (putative translation factor)
MKTNAEQSASREVRRVARHLGKLVHQARLARRMPQAELAVRARSSEQTVRRLESGSTTSSLGAWLSAMEQLGLLPLLGELKDHTSEQLLVEHRARRARLNTPEDLDF